MVSPSVYYLPRARRPVAPDIGVQFIVLLFGYTALLALAHIGHSGLLKALANLYAVVLFVILIFAWVMRPLKPKLFGDFAIALVVFYVGMGCSLIVNPEYIRYADLLKTLMVPAFIVIGATAQRGRMRSLWSIPVVRVCFWAMLLLPIVVLAVQVGRSGLDFDSSREAGIFSNRNNAGLFAITMIGLYGVLTGRALRSVVLMLVAGAIFATLGLLLAVCISLLIAVGRRRDLIVLLSCLMVATLGYFLIPEFGPYQRIDPVVKSIQYIIAGRIDLRTVTFGQLVILLGTTDLSFLFRLKHWLDLWDLMAAASPYHWLFGFGVDSAARLSRMQLVPHNDYVRIGFEYGLVTLSGFVGILAIMYRRLGLGWISVPSLTVVIYFLSENLLTNYIAMSIFFFSVGALCQRKSEENLRSKGDIDLVQ